MNDNIKILAIIPAREGSKRLPKKNILKLHGKPLISYSIEAAKQSKYITKTITSSDSLEILDIAKSLGSDIINRPKELATDTTSTYDTIIHLLNNIDNKEFEYFILLQPTSPLRNSNHIDESIDLLFDKQADSIISVTIPEHSPLWCESLSSDLNMNNFLENDFLKKRSQDLPLYYRLNGAIYICNTQKFLKEKTFFYKDKTFAYIMGKKDSIDIDEKLDFLIAKELLQDKKND